MSYGVLHSRLERHAVARRAEGDVDDASAVVDRIGDPLCDVGYRSAAGAVERLDREDARVRRDARDAEGVVRVGGDDPGDVRAVRVVVRSDRIGAAARGLRGEDRDTREDD